MNQDILFFNKIREIRPNRYLVPFTLRKQTAIDVSSPTDGTIARSDIQDRMNAVCHKKGLRVIETVYNLNYVDNIHDSGTVTLALLGTENHIGTKAP